MEESKDECSYSQGRGMQYTEVLKNIKRAIKVDEIGVNVKKMRKTTKGQLLVVLNGGNEESETLKKVMQEKIERCEERTTNRERLLFVADIDGDITKEEVEEALNKELRQDEASPILRVKSIRETGFGSQTAMVTAETGTAERLLKKGMVRIGWSRYSIRERVDTVRCFRCLQFGHQVKECQRPDRKTECLRCGREGHKAKDCKNGKRCPMCEQDGHRVDSTGCPRFREAVKSHRLRNRRGGLRVKLPNYVKNPPNKS